MRCSCCASCAAADSTRATSGTTRRPRSPTRWRGRRGTSSSPTTRCRSSTRSRSSGSCARAAATSRSSSSRGPSARTRRVVAMKAGAADYLVKGQLKRLAPAVERELRDANARAERRRSEETRVRLSETLRATEERFRTLVGSLDDVVFTLDRDKYIDGVYG